MFLPLLFLSAFTNRFGDSVVSNRDTAALEAGFRKPPRDVRLGCYWYWIDKTVTKKGVIADLKAMKRAGITRAFIGMTGGGDELKFMSDQWWELLHTTLKTASDLDIEIGLFNCPGWSQSGGPWIKNNQAMRYLAAVERQVTGPTLFSEKIPITSKDIPSIENIGWSNESYQAHPADFQDVKVIAFPIDPHLFRNLFDENKARISFSGNIKQQLENKDTLYQLPQNETASVMLELPQKMTARSLTIAIRGRISCDAELQYLGDDQVYKTISTFKIDRVVDGLMRGFIPNSPVVVSFATVNARAYRILFRNSGSEGLISGFTLTAAPVIERFPEKTFAKMFNSFTPPWDAYMWDFQTTDAAGAVQPRQVIDISDHLAPDGTLRWKVPSGKWVILRTGMLPTGLQNSPSPKGATGLEVDKMSGKLAEYHFDSYIGKILKRIPAEDRKTFRLVVLDSYEKGGQNFTDDFIDLFRQQYGYDPTPYLPAYYGYPIGSPALSNRFLWDMRRMVADRMAHQYIGTITRKANENGLKTWLENYGTWGFAGEFLNYGGQSDQVGGEFWLGDYLGKVEIRCASSAAHTYGKPQVWAESFTGSGPHYTVYPGAIKQKGDWAMAEGVNAFMLHVYIQQQADNIFPGVDAWYNMEFNRKNAWFSQIDLFTTYLRRCSFMLQQGLNVADVAYYIGEDAPKMDGIVAPEIPAGYHYDFINAEVLLHSAQVKDGKLVLPHGTQYRVLVLPPQTTMRPEILEKIGQLIEAGLLVIGAPPWVSPSLQNYPHADQKVQALSKKIWGAKTEKEHRYGKGKIYTQTSLEKVFQQLNLPPDLLLKDSVPVHYTHRKIGDTDIYFLSNQSNQRIQFNAQFRVAQKQPEYWNTLTGDTRCLKAFTQADATTLVPLQLEPSGSAFIVFRRSGKPMVQATEERSVQENFPEPKFISEIITPWTVQFMSDSIHRGPTEAVLFKELQDWSESSNPKIKHYSGTAVYKNRFKIAALQRTKSFRKLWIDFEKVGMMAKVKINGQYAGGVWAYPYRVNILPFIKEGENDLEVEVVNTWGNRIIGDLNLPQKERRLQIHQGPAANAPLQESGITGKVSILAE
ncbi:hypothetical protein A8C56_09605 [Niabella ginsenosidivorans]|uniref:Glycoside hydrolase family 2 n=1 Tax=Niabella ginsenosidivorans TaxID=1176587 RepID=A0A1A9IAS0_9BACT|nr:hypothetical protein A8C56_09605 [Niabella ginsenosidivorans]